MRKETRLKRLEMLSDMLKRHKEIFPKASFDIGVWASPHTFDTETASENFVEGNISCGFAACALGSAACFPPFRKMGLKLQNGFGLEPSYKTYRSFNAGTKFFGITEDESNRLFDPEAYRNPPKAITVAKRVDKLIQQYSQAQDD